MSTLQTLQVFQALNSSPNARLEHSAELGDGLAAALWSNHHDAQDYEAPTHHTLSCYIAGGTGTFRRERPDTTGAPDKLCILPAGHESAWVINGDIRLAHLYFSAEQFALGCVTLLDREPRQVQLHEETFLDDPRQAQRFRQLIALNWDEPGERLLTTSLAHDLLNHLLLSQVGQRQGLRLKGGLAAHQRRLLVDYVDSHLANAISLGQLAALCALSEYHFARMFRESFGLPPHQYVLARRLTCARHLLRTTSQPLGDVALACGFASASHFTNRFRQALGATPGEYRQAFLR
ncbi:helix-turn-helix domain-containing protein [Pseudomonas brassicacearum]|uniref:Putative transcription factor, AraC family n=1 Tax=Pseudomonas brassicacearum (strain NFM421) TaxID=994484 RepID=F2KL58_PSEBN|nr:MULTISPECIES: AraC family transcriptional regulator [Pseudomonas]EIK58267.1 transcriptional regulator, AraC family [Pseudomonas fluorescens Q8r1-96]AEA71099.1 Putative transcription factor, AraC family [Pseudomonas brassicacearum subsp. brassicacearum NFM421]KAB0526785.1 helix-turn-helix transcriptional regulator [Pseudomonas brassicacearum subsp. brassicacearum]NJP60670.1 helix-turn-helix transcriptional regulator [Pseudomonas brassicacearum]QEO80790.1 AraC family transcriptional regulator